MEVPRHHSEQVSLASLQGNAGEGTDEDSLSRLLESSMHSTCASSSAPPPTSNWGSQDDQSSGVSLQTGQGDRYAVGFSDTADSTTSSLSDTELHETLSEVQYEIVHTQAGARTDDEEEDNDETPGPTDSRSDAVMGFPQYAWARMSVAPADSDEHGDFDTDGLVVERRASSSSPSSSSSPASSPSHRHYLRRAELGWSVARLSTSIALDPPPPTLTGIAQRVQRKVHRTCISTASAKPM